MNRPSLWNSIQVKTDLCCVQLQFALLKLLLLYEPFPYRSDVSGYATCTFWFAIFIFKLAFESSIMHYAVPIFLWIGGAPVI